MENVLSFTANVLAVIFWLTANRSSAASDAELLLSDVHFYIHFLHKTAMQRINKINQMLANLFL